MLILFDIGPMEEFQFLFYIMAVTLGVQLSIYFFYQYWRIQDVTLKLNRILLSFGAFTILIVLGALFINVQRLFGGDITDIFYRIGWAFALASPIGFLGFIVIEEFSIIMNLMFVKILMVLALIPILCVCIFGVGPIFLGSLPFSILSAYYIIGVQIKLIWRTMGTIKRKFIQFISGEFLSLASIPFAVMVGIGIFKSPVKEVVYYTGVSLLITGFIILFISAHEFPPFYEFEWKDNLLRLFVIYQEDNTVLYYSNLTEIVGHKKHKITQLSELGEYDKDKIFSVGLAGIEKIISTITDTKSERINKIQQEDAFIHLEYGENVPITYALAVKKDLASFRHLLKSFKQHFENLYGEIILNLGTIKARREDLFRSFDTIVNLILER
ncbi:MAG: hypothetical protein ACTSRC_20250 [Candidatus Helarchaeota archaeon]